MLSGRTFWIAIGAVLLASAPVCLVPDPHITDGCAQRVSPEELPAPWRNAMQGMAGSAMAKYRRLVFETPGFIEYWQAATPIEEIKRMHIGSRHRCFGLTSDPSRR